MTASVITIRTDTDDQELRDARELIGHLNYFTSNETKAQWLALVLRSRRSEAEYQASMRTVRNIMGDLQ